MVVEMVTSLSLEGYCTSLSGVFLVYSVCGRKWGKNSVLGRFVVFPSKFVWNSQVPFKVKSFVWLVAHKKHGESADHLFLHCSLTIRLWHRLFQLAKMDWVPPRSIFDMMFIKFNGFGSSKKGLVLWQAASIALIRVVWWERNTRIFEDKARNLEYLWDSIVFLASLWAFCSKVFKGTPLNVLQLDWLADNPQGKSCQKNVWSHSGGGVWAPRFSRSINDWEVIEVERLLLRLQGRRVYSDVEDEVIWTKAKDKRFSVKSLYKDLDPERREEFPANIIWNSLVPPRMFMELSFLSIWSFMGAPLFNKRSVIGVARALCGKGKEESVACSTLVPLLDWCHFPPIVHSGKKTKEKAMSVLSPYRMVGSHDFMHDNNSNSQKAVEMGSQPFVSLLEL
ncbi:hypothetical protein CK203_076446 [Vitis vinifera]|uniref:Reverse transcriptase zinc-binding domain-containing protein n=1 Tax=Vitis vinifera TaxID=29760 RepID=A0A438C0J1_VITVI|nr:hypothetical protein CK203_076446 [Vitis vinifera]